MARFIIRGGKTLSGTHRPPGNKNAALPMLAACLLTDKPVTLSNVPLIEDVRTMLAILEGIGVDVDVHGSRVTLRARTIKSTRLAPVLCGKVRSSILFAGPMCARAGRVTLSPPGGDSIGRRRVDTHLEALRAMGVRVSGNDTFTFVAKQPTGTRVLLDEASVTATENAVMLATLAKGVTSIYNAACEPHVQDLCNMLNSMGARIGGIGTNLLQVKGVPSLSGTDHRVASDSIEAASFIAAAALTGGALKVPDVNAEEFAVIGRCFRKFGVMWKISGGVLRLPAIRALEVNDDLGHAIPKIEDGPWPNYPSDLMSAAIVLAARSRGTALFFEKMFESRMYFVDRLIEMGARIVQCDPHRVLVSGPSRLRGSHMSSPDIRAGMALLLAALCADGESRIDNAQIIDRGYEQVEERLRALGADIERVE